MIPDGYVRVSRGAHLVGEAIGGSSDAARAPWIQVVSSDGSDHGSGGASARREYERRKRRREQAVRDKHPRIGGLLVALSEPPAHERRWAHGAGGEELVAAALDKRCKPDVVVLHDRAVPGSRANIDHIAVGPSGVWVIDTKRYSGRIQVSKPLFGNAKLKIGGRDQSKLVAAPARQVALVQTAVIAINPTAPVHGAFCFVEGDLPLVGTLNINDFPLLRRRSLPKRLSAAGPLAIDAILELAGPLAQHFPPRDPGPGAAYGDCARRAWRQRAGCGAVGSWS